MEKRDEQIVCRDCGKEFTFTIGEQEFYEEKGFSIPVRCKDCRNARKAAKEADAKFAKPSLNDSPEEFRVNMEHYLDTHTVKFEKSED